MNRGGDEIVDIDNIKIVNVESEGGKKVTIAGESDTIETIRPHRGTKIRNEGEE